MWCRAEMVCHALRNGSSKMWLATSAEQCDPLEQCHDAIPGEQSVDAWLAACLHIFDGDATRPADQLDLVLPVLGLYAELYATTETNPSCFNDHLAAAITMHRRVRQAWFAGFERR